MMDFTYPSSTRNLEVLTRLIRKVPGGKGKGFLLESGRSYHYYGVELLTNQEWRVFLGKCLLTSGWLPSSRLQPISNTASLTRHRGIRGHWGPPRADL
jgi:hypothetical protein